MGAGAAGARRSSRLVAVFPILWTVWESLHLHDLRMPWLGRPFVGARQLRRSARRSAVLERARRTPSCSSPVTRDARARRPASLLALALDRVSRGRGLVRTAVAAAVGDSDRRGGARLALHVREPGRPRRAAGRSRGSGRRRRRGSPIAIAGVGADRARRRLEDDAVRRAAAARRAAEHRSMRSTRPPQSTAPAAGAQFVDDHAAAAQARAAGRAALSRARRVPRLRPGLRADRRRARHGDRADRALHVQHAAAEPALRLRLGAVGDRLRRGVRLRARRASACSGGDALLERSA